MTDELLGQIAAATITAAGGILVAFLGVRASQGERPRIGVHRAHAASDERLKLVQVQVPSSAYESPSRGHWLLRLAICLVVAVVCLAGYIVSSYRYLTTGLDPAWAFVGLVPGVLGSVLFGFGIAMVRMGMTGAGEHAQTLEVEGGFQPVVEGVTGALRRMKMRVRSLDVADEAAVGDPALPGDVRAQERSWFLTTPRSRF